MHLQRFRKKPNGEDLQALDLGVRSRPWSQWALTEQEVRSTFQRAPPLCAQPKPPLGKKHLITKSSTNDAQSSAERVIREWPAQ